MNNNKKYKKWSLGLVAPALVLAPIAVVASCSSSGEEKPAYGVTFTNNDKIKATIHKAVQPADLTDVQFKEEVLAHKSDLFTIEGTLPSDSFLNDNIEISELKPSADTKTVSANVKLNKANTNGEPIEKTITLTGLGYEEVTLTDLKYTIAFKDQTNPQEIALTDQENISVATLTAEKLIDLVLTTDNKAKILDITGNDATKITDEVLANQILKATELKPAATEGKITFKLSVEKPENGAGNTLDKEITFAGFKVETDSTTPTEAYTIGFKAKESDDKYLLTTVSSKTTEEFPNDEDIKALIIQEKSVIFEATKGNLPGEQSWWETNLVITNPAADATAGEISVTIQLNNSDSSDPSQNIKETNVILKGFQKQVQAPVAQETVMNAQLSTVTLGLNGNRAEAKPQITQQWIFDRVAILFKQGSDLIKDVNDIVAGSIKTEDVATGKGNPIKIKFKVAANKWYDNTPAEGTTEKEFETTVSGLSGGATANTELKNKLAATETDPLAIGLVDPRLAEGTYEAFRDNAANIFTKKFIFDYRKHLLTGDFTKADQANPDTLLKEYPEDTSTQTPATFVKVIPSDSTKKIQIKFTILKDKIVPTPGTDKEFSIVFSGFKGN